MRVNVYAEELSHDVQVFSKTSETGRTFFAVRFLFHSAPQLHNRPGDDDRSAVTFWVPWTKAGGHQPGIIVGLFEAAIALLRAQITPGSTVHTPQEVRTTDFLRKLEGIFNTSESVGNARSNVLSLVREFLGLGLHPYQEQALDVISRGIAPGIDGRGCVRTIPGMRSQVPSVLDTDYYREVWQHAACLTIAEGGPDWDKASDTDSAAMIAVRKLRWEFEKLREQKKTLEDMLGSIRRVMTRSPDA